MEILERQGDMFAQPRSKEFPLVVTTNGTIKKNGECVMGRGIARQVRDYYPSFARDLGECLTLYGNRPFRIREDIWTLPVKKAWYEKADLVLIQQSLGDMIQMVWRHSPGGLHLPRPGCGNGGLDWKDVQPLVEEFAAGLGDGVIHVWDFDRRN